jgi:thiamine transport system ATP-binding protein
VDDLVVDGVTVELGGTVVLDAVDLVVGAGEIVSVLGPSGSGKSTLLRAIAGLEPLQAGRIRRGPTDLAGVSPNRRDLGLMFQEPTLFPHRDVLANVMFGPRMRGVSRAQAADRARELLGLVGLAGYEHRPVAALSGGEQQRVALARALAPSPALLMLDEPLGSLDRRLREHLVDELGRIFRAIDQSVLFVTHDHDEAFGLADRVAVLHAGRIEQVGPPVALWRRPETAFVAAFLGWNVVELSPPVGRVAIRPDALHVDDRGTMRGTVTGRTFRRDHWSVHVSLDPGTAGGPGAGVDVVVRDTSPPAAGAAVCLRIDDDGIVTV